MKIHPPGTLLWGFGHRAVQHRLLQGITFGYADLQRLDFIIKGQVQHVLPFYGFHVAHQLAFVVGLDGAIVNKYFHLDIGTSVSVAGALICCTAFAINPFRLVVIGLIGTWINGLALDYFTAGLNRRKRVCIISKDYERIRKYIIEDLQRGCSLYNVTGGYHGHQNIEIQSLLTQHEFASLMDFIKVNDIHGFITAGNVSEIYGEWNAKTKKKSKIF